MTFVIGVTPVPSAFALKISAGAVSDARENTIPLPSGVTCTSPFEPSFSTSFGAPPASSIR